MNSVDCIVDTCEKLFPAATEDYKVGEPILALCHDNESNVWSTMFYEAAVLAVNNDHKLTVLYKDSDVEVDLGAAHLTRFSPDFDIHESETEQEEKRGE